MTVQHSIRTVLEQTLHDVESRSQIEACLSELLTDVELSVQLQQQIQTRMEITKLRRQLKEHEYIIAESYAIREHQSQQNSALANQMTIDLWSASREIGSLLSMKERHEELLEKYDGLVAKLLQAEDEIADAKNKKIESKTSDNLSSSQEQENENLHNERNQDPGKVAESTFVNTPNGLTSTPVALTEIEGINKPKSVEACDDLALSKHKPPGTNTSISQEHVVVIIEDDHDAPPTLDSFDTEILLHIFLFLDPLDVLNTAQINISMYSRVDSIFNPGSAGGEENPVLVAESSTMSDGVGKSQQVPSQAEQSVCDPISKTASLVSVPDTIPPEQRQIQPTIVTIPDVVATTITSPPRIKTSNNVSIASPTSSVSSPQTTPSDPSSRSRPSATTTSTAPLTTAPASLGTPGSRGIFSILQPKLRPSTTPPRNRTDSLDAGSQQSQPFQPLNAAMASSMAAKLSDAELNAIILMTERLKQKEQLAAQYKSEKDALAAKLDGTESVKQFLIAKVRDMEASLNATFDKEIKFKQQAERDQEVIAYLDTKVQEYKRQVCRIESEKKAALDELDAIRKQASERSAVMSDMLHFEREKLQENEREWKSTRKLLIKEVKSLRSQVAALQDECEVYRDEKDSFSRVIKNNNIGSNGYYHHHHNSNSSSIGRAGSFT
jgi:hypothetical protein